MGNSMDTHEKYLDAEFYVQLAGESEPEYITEYHRTRAEDPHNNVSGYDPTDEFRDHHILNEDVPIDGYVQFYNPEKGENGDAFLHFGFPFRDHRADDAPWFAFPDKPKWERHPVWEWRNPEADPHEDLTLHPSLGIGDPMTFHCWIRNGEVEWL